MKNYSLHLVLALALLCAMRSPESATKTFKCTSKQYDDLSSSMTVPMINEFDLTNRTLRWSLFGDVELPVKKVYWETEDMTTGLIKYEISGSGNDNDQFEGSITFNLDQNRISVQLSSYIGDLWWSLEMEDFMSA